jgi:hypothetical protein
MCSSLQKAKIYYRRLNIPSDHYSALVAFLKDKKKLFSVSNTTPAIVLLVSDEFPIGELIAYGIYGKKNFFLGLYNFYLTNNNSFSGLASNIFCLHSHCKTVKDGQFKQVIRCTECEVPCC